MMIRKKHSTKPGRRKEQRSCNSPEENSNHTEETQHEPFQIPSIIRVGQENGNKWNTHIRSNQEELKEVMWCFMYIKEKTLGENYKEVFELWRERNPMMRINADATLFLNQKNYILKAKRRTPVEIDETKENIRLKIWNVQRITQMGTKWIKMIQNRERPRIYQ
jgi:hypothetical protein